MKNESLPDKITRAESNRQNAAKSTGPRDTTSTRFNALKHGLLAEGVTELDSPEAFPNFRAKVEEDLRPVGEMEKFLVQRIALAMVRLKRAEMLEAEFVTAQLNPPITKNEGRADDLNWEADFGTIVVLDPGIPARLSVEALVVMANTLSRYETTIGNRLLRDLNQLERMQWLRQGETIASPVSLEVGLHTDGLASFGNPPFDPRGESPIIAKIEAF